MSLVRAQDDHASGAPARLRVLSLAFVAALLAVDGVGVEAQPAPASQMALSAFGAADIDAELEAWNPSLGERSRERIAAAVMRYSAEYELDPALVAAVIIVESGARPWVVSPKGAVGLMQVMPHMMDPLRLAGNPATIESNIEAGCWILANNIDRLGEERGISAYFWGSDIRGLAYFEKVREARERLRPS